MDALLLLRWLLLAAATWHVSTQSAAAAHRGADRAYTCSSSSFNRSVSPSSGGNKKRLLVHLQR